jgi:hypothetical protein
MVRPRARGKIAWAGQGPHNAARTEGTPIVKLSLSSAWNEAKAVIASESRLLASVALAFFVLPGIVLWATVPETAHDKLPPPGPWVAVLIAILLVSLVGQVAIARMAMPPHISVGEAVQRGLRRLLPFFLAFLLWVVPMVIIGAILYSFAALNPASSPGIALAALILLCALTVLALFMVVRLILAAAVAAAEEGNAVHILKRSFELTRGNWWQLFAFIFLYGLSAAVLLKAIEWVLGILANVVLGGVGPMTIGGLVVTIIVELASAAVSVTFFVIVARLYLQLAGREPAGAGVPKSGT